MARPYLTVKQYSMKYGIPKSTLYTWAREGKIKVDKTGYPTRILDEDEPPKKNPDVHKWRYDVDWDRKRG